MKRAAIRARKTEESVLELDILEDIGMWFGVTAKDVAAGHQKGREFIQRPLGEGGATGTESRGDAGTG